MSGKVKVLPALATAVATSTVGVNAIEKREPVKATLALEMLAGGETYEAVARATGLSFTSIAALRARNDKPLEERRKQLAVDGFEMAEGLRLLAKQKMQSLADNPEELAKVNLRDLVLPYAIAQDKAFAALGENKVIVEHRRGASLEDAMREIEAVRAKIRQSAIEVDVTPVVAKKAAAPDDEDEEEGEELPQNA
jgi:hypothetical protein